jgi:hypothetical protein
METTEEHIVFDAERLTHKVTYTVERKTRFSLSPNYAYKWMLTAECEECGWFGHVVRNCYDMENVMNITQRDKDELLLDHHLGIMAVYD